MTDPLILSSLGTIALTEGIKFLYGQAGEVLKRWRERKATVAKENTSQSSTIESIKVNLPSLFEGQLSTLQIHFDVVDRLEEQLRELRKDMIDYADGIEIVDSSDNNLLQRVDALRQLLEAIYQQRLTFKGEQRPPSGPVVEGRIDVEEIAGYVAAVRARRITSGQIRGEATADHVVSGGQLVGVETDIVGE